MNNADQPAYPAKYKNNDGSIDYSNGLSKHELFCLHNGVPETGDEELNDIIRKGNRNKAAMAAMQGMLSNPHIKRPHPNEGDLNEQLIGFSMIAIEYADPLLKELDKPKEV